MAPTSRTITRCSTSLESLGIPTFYTEGAPPNGQYVSSPESRTIWVQVDETNFTTLFGPSAVLRDGGTNALGEQVIFWEGNLSLPKSMVDAGVVGLWFDTGLLATPILPAQGTGPQAMLPAGPQSPGNSVARRRVSQRDRRPLQFPLCG